MSRSAIAVLSTENLLHNIKFIQEKVGKAKIIAMIKANAYGHGIRSVGKRLDKYADLLGVASIDEALALRKSGVKADIILMQGVFEENELLLASVEKFHVVFNNETQIDWLDKSALPTPLTSWIKINTGMGRLGFNLEDAKQAHDRLTSHKNCHKPIKIMSHFACANDKDHPNNKKQIENFREFIKNYDTEYSISNSASILHFPDCIYDYVRPGILLYGVSPIKGITGEELGLKPVMTVQSTLISVQSLKKGDFVGYGAKYQCEEDMRVGIIAFGYGDGYPITAKNGTPILVSNIECPLIGAVSMDMIAVDLRPCQDAKIGDHVILWGNGLPIERVVENTANIVWDILTGMQNRVKFLWTGEE